MHNLRLVKYYTTWLGHKSSYWDYFDKAIKLTGSTECISRTLLSLLLQRFEKKDQIMEDAIKQLKALSLIRTFMCHLLNLAGCVKQLSKSFEITHFCVHSLIHCAFTVAATGGVL